MHRLHIFGLTGIVCCTAIGAAYSQTQDTSYECDLSGHASGNLASCPGDSTSGYRTSTVAVQSDGTCAGAEPYCGARSDPGSAIAPIEAWGICRWIDNASTQSIFVPIKTSVEWADFRTAAPTLLGGNVISLVDCAVPYSDNGAPATTTLMPPFAGCTQISAATPGVYGRTNVSLYPYPSAAGPNFTCHNGSTSMMSAIQWKAGDVGTVAAGVSSWNPNFYYSPDITLVVSPPVVDSGTAVSLSWSIAPYIAGDAVSCSVSPGGWGPDGNGNPRVGSNAVVLTSTTNFSLSCTEAPGLTSTASATGTANPPPAPEDDGDSGSIVGDGGALGGSAGCGAGGAC